MHSHFVSNPGICWAEDQIHNAVTPHVAYAILSIPCLLMPWHLRSQGISRHGMDQISWNIHSIESPSMVDPQWNIWYWGSKWNLHTVCWDAVGCEWGTTSVYFGITYVCFIPSRLPFFAVSPSTDIKIFFIFVKSIIWMTHTKSSKKFMLV